MIRLGKHGKSVVFEEPAADIDESDNDRGVRAPLGRGEFYEEAFLEYIRSLKKKGAYASMWNRQRAADEALRQLAENYEARGLTAEAIAMGLKPDA